MPSKDAEFVARLLATFRVEADEHLKAMSSGLLELEQAAVPERSAEIIERVFREAHSLKGAARAVNQSHIESVCQSLESVFAALKTKKLAATSKLFDVLHQALRALDALPAQDSASTSGNQPAIAALVRQLDAFPRGTSPRPEQTAAAAKPHEADVSVQIIAADTVFEAASGPVVEARSTVPDTVRVSTEKLDAVMRQVEELLSPRLALGEHVRGLRDTSAELAAWKKKRAQIQPVLRALERSLDGNGETGGTARRLGLAKLLEYFEAESLHLRAIEGRLATLRRFAERDERTLTAMTQGLVHDAKEMQLLPFSGLLGLFSRLVRDLSRDQGKEVSLAIQGAEIEIDRRILEEMKDPLTHVLRNCIDHGIERPDVRGRERKPAQGTITLAVSQKDGGKVEVLVADDGAGIDLAKVKASACKLGVLSPEEAEKLGESEAAALAFHSGVSTNPIITDISGRGLGLAIVREKVERLGGAIAIESRPGTGTVFRLTLPLALATYRGILVRAGDQLFVIPAAAVDGVARVAVQDIRTVENRETIELEGEAVSLARLADVLEIPRKEKTKDGAKHMQAVILGAGAARIAFQVEELLGEQEVLVKPLGAQLARVRNVAGATVLGTGRVAPVLNVHDLMKSAVKRSGMAPAAAAAPETAPPAEQTILVVEDSITSRSLLKNILEAAGYRVATAVDGIDAYTTLKTGTFDLVVSDVDMPRMNGFDLTAKVRLDKQLGELPIVLVTALGSREDRERGIEVGANAYIVKSSFDQSNLLEVVRRLI